METPTLSKKQQKKALKGRKGPKETVKTVLANPHSNHFPIINEEDAEALQTIIKKMPRLKAEKRSVPWKLLKETEREKRKSIREEYLGEKIVEDLDVKSHLIFGVNNVTKHLEKNQLSTVLITEDVNPRFMVRHIIDLSVLKNTHCLVIPKLRDMLNETIGIRSIVIGIKNDPKNNVLKDLVETVGTISLNYLVPERHMYYNGNGDDVNRSLDGIMNNLELQSDDGTVKNETVINFEEEEEEDDATIKNETVINFEEEEEDIYLYRKTSGERIFIPDLSQKQQIMGESEFLAFTEHEKDVGEIKPYNSYRGLIVKRLRNNKDRRKKIKL